MLARHLLFIATRRPHNSLLSLPPESVPPHAGVQPPPYVPPPKVDDQHDQKSREILNESSLSPKIHAQNEKQQHCDRQQLYVQGIYAHDSHRNFYDDHQRFFERNNLPSYNESQRDRQIVQMQNAKNQQYYVLQKDVNQQFYTLPARRPQREIEPPRSVTPDITRGLRRGSLSTMHMLAKHGQRPTIEQHSNQCSFQANAKNDLQAMDPSTTMAQSQQQRTIADMRNRLPSPLSLSALGYRFFASSPVHDPVMKSPSADALKHNPISPIGHAYRNGFRSSTPTGRNMPTVAERLALTTGSNCSSPVQNSSGRSTPVQMSSGRSTPTNLILSPTKSTMSNEELFAAIHKSKKRLNIKDDSETLSPYGSMNSLVKTPTSPKPSCNERPQKPREIVQNAHSPSATSRLDFKRLLLQQSVKAGTTRLSAAEQLKLSRQQCQQQQPQSLTVTQQVPLAKVLSPRSAWRFQTPRTDVLSSTIIEDTAAEEKAMKPSPENTSPLSRLNARRQLDLRGELPENLRLSTFDCKPSGASDNIPQQPEPSSPASNAAVESRKSIQRLMTDEPSAIAATDNHPVDSLCTRTFRKNTLPGKSATPHGQDKVAGTPTTQYLPSGGQRTLECQGAISAFESRRISNQLARAQFLASTPASNDQGHNPFKKRFRARSESPQHPATQNVTRSPSAPTLETAL